VAVQQKPVIPERDNGRAPVETATVLIDQGSLAMRFKSLLARGGAQRPITENGQ
jgi:hypothetical protein